MDINFSISNFLVGVIAATSIQFFVLAYHAKIYKRERFLSIWLLGTGMLILAFISSIFADQTFIKDYSIMIHNFLIIFGQGLYYVSIKEYFIPQSNFKRYRMDFAFLTVFLTILSVFSTNTSIRMISNSLVLLLFSLFVLKILYAYKKKDIDRSINVFIIVNWINAIFWIGRIVVIFFILPKHPEIYNIILVMSYLSSLLLCIIGSLGLILVINQKLTYTVEKEKLKIMTILETIPDSVIVSRLRDGKVEFTNDKFVKTMKYSPNDLIDKDTLQLGIWRDKSSRERYINSMDNLQSIENYEDYLYAKDGSEFLACISASKLFIEGEEYIISVIRDVSEIRYTEKQLVESERRYKRLSDQLRIEKEAAERNSLTDELTGLANRRYLQDRITFEYARMNRTGLELSLVMLDVDFFKAYNDTYGHIKGDEALKEIGESLKLSIRRATDLAARYGGEEFVILLPDTDKKAARILAEKIRKNIEKLGIEHRTSTIASVITVSAGVVTFDKDTCSCVNNLLDQVDQALYQAKENGRNIVVQV